jgi:eukaryotic-like serine/threonine-protein kinase
MNESGAGPSSSDSLSATRAEELDRACDRFEAEWRSGDPPDLAAYLARAEGGERAVLARELIAIDVHWRRRVGEHPVLAEYLTTFPCGEATINSVFGLGEVQESVVDREVTPPSVPASPEITARDGAADGREPTPRPEIAPLIALPGYEILGELGRGGMGVVYKARQSRLNRTVAVKMILAGLHGGREVAARFLAEARAIAKVQHPNIVQIFHTAEHDGYAYLEMEFVGGGNLSGRLDGVPRPPREAARLIETLSFAMAEVHRHGVVHRDLKPSNILLTEEGVPKVADFGLAKLLDADLGLTHTDSVLGSPSYMAPEQADGKAKNVGPPADVYALGAILYELLTGRPPFRGETVLDTLQQVKTAEPVPPSRLVPGLPRDIETITLKCLQKDPTRRYPDASVLAEDLRRFIHREPIRARRAGNLERASGWCRRQPLVASLLGVVASLLVAMVVGSVVFVLRLSQAADRSERARRLAETTLADMFTRSGVEAGSRGDPASAVLWFANAARQARGDLQRRQANQIRVRTWSRDVAMPVQAFQHDEFSVGDIPLGSLSFSPDGRYLLTGGLKGRPFVWDLAHEQKLGWVNDDGHIRPALWGPGGEWLALGLKTGEVAIRNLPDGRELHRIPQRGPIAALAISPDGSFLAIASDVIRLWDCRAGTCRTTSWAQPGPVSSVYFSPDGNLLLAGCKGGQALVFDTSAANRQAGPMFPPVPHRPPRDPVAPRFVDHGRGFLTVTEPEMLTWWDARTGSRIRTLRCPLVAIDAFEISSDGKYLAVGGYAGCQVWALSASPEQGHLLAHPNSVQSIRFSPDDRSLVTGGAGRAAGLWSLPDGSPIGSPIVHQSFVDRVAYSPDGRFLATEQLDGLMRVWRLPPEESPGYSLTEDKGVDAGRLGPDGRHVIAAAERTTDGVVGKTSVYDAVTGEPFGSNLGFSGILRDARLSPDGHSAATIAWLPDSRRGQLEFWEIGTGARAMPPIPLPSEPIHLAYSPDGRSVAVFCRGGEIPVIGTEQGGVVVMAMHRPIGQLAHLMFSHLGFSPDGLNLVTLGADQSIQVADPATGRPRYPAVRLGSAGWFVNFSRDGYRMTVGTADGRVRVWALATGRLECELPKHSDWVYMAVFSPDGRQILTACRDGEARLWDLDTQRLVCPPFKHSVEVLGVAFSPDGRHVATSSRDETIRVWEWHTGGPVMPALNLGGLGTFTLAFTADGRHLVGSGRQPATGLTSFDTGELTAADTIDLDDICTLGELVSSTKLYNGDLAGLTTAEWLERWQEFHRHHPGLAVYTPSRGGFPDTHFVIQ